MTVTDTELFQIVKTALEHSEKRITEQAVRIAAGEAVATVFHHLRQVGVLDENDLVMPNARLKIRVVNAACYIPLVIEHAKLP